MQRLRRLAGRDVLLAVVGMAAVWPSIHNQILYPVTFTYVKDGAPPAIVLFLAFAVLQLLTCAVLFAARRRAVDAVFGSAPAMGAVGVLGALGTALLINVGFESATSTALVAVGLALVSVYVPVYFAFWATQLCRLGDGGHADGWVVAMGAVLSYILFCLFTAGRLALDMHASTVAVLYPLASTAAALATVLACPRRPLGDGAFSPKQLQLNIVVPSLLFTWVCTFVIVLLNPASSLSDYPPRRWALYLISAALFALVAFIYLRNPDALRRCAVQAFAMLSIYLVGAVLLTALGMLDAFSLGNFAAIAGKNAFELFILMLVLIGAHNSHVNPVGPVCAFFALVPWASHLATALLTYQGGLGELGSTNSLWVVAVVVGAAFLVSLTVNVVLVLFVARTPKARINDVPDAPRGLDDAKLAALAQAWGLSKREGDIVRLLCENTQTSKIAEGLCIAESTVYTHLKRIYRKAGVHSKYELVDLVETFGK